MHLPEICTVMIREKAIFFKLNQIHFSDKQLFEQALSDFVPSKCSCPACGAVGRFEKAQSYNRFLISVSHGERIETVVSVPQIKCTSCGHTHAILPDILIPFGSYSLRFILTILYRYLTRPGTVADFCEHWGIAISTLYGWIHLFIDQYNAWCRVLDRILWICKDAIGAIRSFHAFPSDFFHRFRFSFLQRQKTSPTVPVLHQDRRRKTSCK